MPIKDAEGGVFHTIGRVYDNLGASQVEIGKVYDNDGTANHEIWSAEQDVLPTYTFTGVASPNGEWTQSASTLYVRNAGSDEYTGAYALVDVTGYSNLEFTVTEAMGDYNTQLSFGLSSNTNFTKFADTQTAWIVYQNLAESKNTGVFNLNIAGQSGLKYIKAYVWHSSPASFGQLRISKIRLY